MITTTIIICLTVGFLAILKTASSINKQALLAEKEERSREEAAERPTSHISARVQRRSLLERRHILEEQRNVWSKSWSASTDQKDRTVAWNNIMKLDAELISLAKEGATIGDECEDGGESLDTAADLIHLNVKKKS